MTIRAILSQRYQWDSRLGLCDPLICPPLFLFHVNLLQCKAIFSSVTLARSLALNLLNEGLTKCYDHGGLDHGLCFCPRPKPLITGGMECARTQHNVRPWGVCCAPREVGWPTP